MSALSPQISQMKGMRNSLIDWLSSKMPSSALPTPPGMEVTDPGTWEGAGNSLLQFLVPQPEDTIIAPAELRPNFRSPEQIRALRRLMAEEQRARGPMSQSHPMSKLGNYPRWDTLADDPIDQILRGSWYHGMSEKARGKIGVPDPKVAEIMKEALRTNSPDAVLELLANHKEISNKIVQSMGYKDLSDYVMMLHNSGINPKNLYDVAQPFMRDIRVSQPALDVMNYYSKEGLAKSFETGFPKSLHDAASISNKHGEPAGLSLSLNPTISGKFAADSNIHRVMPLYGGPPTQRTVNLMTGEGRNALNDAYDVVANKTISGEYTPWNPTVNQSALREYFTLPDNKGITDWFANYANKGEFNQALSNQLQNQGYRGILYNPKRWDEYEMLMLDPKYALPLDYRPHSEYVGNPKQGKHIRPSEMMEGGFSDVRISRRAQQGLSQIEDIMATNHSRLGDIYNERSWWDRLSEDTKKMLLQGMPDYENLIKKLKGGK